MSYSIDPISANCYPSTSILINKFDIRDEQKLNEVESVLVSARNTEWINVPRQLSFDFEHYKEIHQYLFSDLYDWAGQVGRLYHLLSPANPDSKKCMSLIIVYIMLTKEVGGAAEWGCAETGLNKHLGLDDRMLYAIFKMVFDNLHQSSFWSITPEFIMDLGEAYLSLLSLKFLREIIT